MNFFSFIPSVFRKTYSVLGFDFGYGGNNGLGTGTSNVIGEDAIDAAYAAAAAAVADDIKGPRNDDGSDGTGSHGGMAQQS